MPQKSLGQKGFAHIIVLGIILLGIAVGVYLSLNPQIFKSKAGGGSTSLGFSGEHIRRVPEEQFNVNLDFHNYVSLPIESIYAKVIYDPEYIEPISIVSTKGFSEFPTKEIEVKEGKYTGVINIRGNIGSSAPVTSGIESFATVRFKVLKGGKTTLKYDFVGRDGSSLEDSNVIQAGTREDVLSFVDDFELAFDAAPLVTECPTIYWSNIPYNIKESTDFTVSVKAESGAKNNLGYYSLSLDGKKVPLSDGKEESKDLFSWKVNSQSPGSHYLYFKINDWDAYGKESGGLPPSKDCGFIQFLTKEGDFRVSYATSTPEENKPFDVKMTNIKASKESYAYVGLLVGGVSRGWLTQISDGYSWNSSGLPAGTYDIQLVAHCDYSKTDPVGNGPDCSKADVEFNKTTITVLPAKSMAKLVCTTYDTSYSSPHLDLVFKDPESVDIGNGTSWTIVKPTNSETIYYLGSQKGYYGQNFTIHKSFNSIRGGGELVFSPGSEYLVQVWSGNATDQTPQLTKLLKESKVKVNSCP